MAEHVDWLTKLFGETVGQTRSEIRERRRGWQVWRATSEVHLESGSGEWPNGRHRQPATEPGGVGVLGGETGQVNEWSASTDAEVRLTVS